MRGPGERKVGVGGAAICSSTVDSEGDEFVSVAKDEGNWVRGDDAFVEGLDASARKVMHELRCVCMCAYIYIYIYIVG